MRLIVIVLYKVPKKEIKSLILKVVEQVYQKYSIIASICVILTGETVFYS